jgi:hypothetical protein
MSNTAQKKFSKRNIVTRVTSRSVLQSEAMTKIRMSQVKQNNRRAANNGPVSQLKFYTQKPTIDFFQEKK